jgi:hypothetical protein
MVDDYRLDVRAKDLTYLRSNGKPGARAREKCGESSSLRSK